MITIRIPMPLPSVANLREHWAKKSDRARRHRGIARMLMLSAFGRECIGPLELLPCVVTITRFSPRALDSDNMASAAKALRDGVADAFGLPDNDERIDWQYRQQKGAASVTIDIHGGRRR